MSEEDGRAVPAVDEEEDYESEWSERTVRWVIAAIAAVLIVCTLGCTVAYVTHPREWMCTLTDTRACEDR